MLSRRANNVLCVRCECPNTLNTQCNNTIWVWHNIGTFEWWLAQVCSKQKRLTWGSKGHLPVPSFTHSLPDSSLTPLGPTNYLKESHWSTLWVTLSPSCCSTSFHTELTNRLAVCNCWNSDDKADRGTTNKPGIIAMRSYLRSELLSKYRTRALFWKLLSELKSFFSSDKVIYVSRRWIKIRLFLHLRLPGFGVLTSRQRQTKAANSFDGRARINIWCYWLLVAQNRVMELHPDIVKGSLFPALTVIIGKIDIRAKSWFWFNTRNIYTCLGNAESANKKENEAMSFTKWCSALRTQWKFLSFEFKSTVHMF